MEAIRPITILNPIGRTTQSAVLEVSRYFCFNLNFLFGVALNQSKLVV